MARDIRKTQYRVRYSLFGLLFLLVILGLILHSYTLLVIMVIAGIVLALVGDKLEIRPTEPFKKYNEDHYERYEPHHHH